jgi:hypothetical protein
MAYSGNGTGTQDDPYQVTTIEQLLECFKIYNETIMGGVIHVYCKLMNDLDFNDNPQYWDCPSNLFYANNTSGATDNDAHIIYIDGDGYGIYNLYCYNKSEIFNVYADYRSHQNQIVMRNLIFEAIAVHTSDRCTLFTSAAGNQYNSGIRFISCDLRIKYYSYTVNSNSEFLLGNVTQFTNCILNIDIILNTQGYTASNCYGSLLTAGDDISSSNFYRNMYNEWKIKVIMISEPYRDDPNYNVFSFFNYTAHLFSSFFIELLAMKGNGWQIFTARGHYMRIMNCYFVIKNIMTSSSYKATPIISVSKNGVNFYDNTTADNIVDGSSGDGTLLALTTAQCKDAEYLEQQGFIIAK